MTNPRTWSCCVGKQLNEQCVKLECSFLSSGDMAPPPSAVLLSAVFFLTLNLHGSVNGQESCGVSSVIPLEPLDVPSSFDDEEDAIPEFRAWGYVCCRADGANFAATLNPNDKLYELPNGEGFCNGPSASTNSLIELQVEQKGAVVGRCPDVAGKAYVPCEISLKGALSAYLDRRRPCTYNPVLSFTCSLDGVGDVKIRANATIRDRNTAPQWSNTELALDAVKENTASGTLLVIPQLGQPGPVASEFHDIWGSENWKVTSFGVVGKPGRPAVVMVDESVTMYPNPMLPPVGDGLVRLALRLARQIDYESCSAMVRSLSRASESKFVNFLFCRRLRVNSRMKSSPSTLTERPVHRPSCGWPSPTKTTSHRCSTPSRPVSSISTKTSRIKTVHCRGSRPVTVIPGWAKIARSFMHWTSHRQHSTWTPSRDRSPSKPASPHWPGPRPVATSTWSESEPRRTRRCRRMHRPPCVAVPCSPSRRWRWRWPVSGPCRWWLARSPRSLVCGVMRRLRCPSAESWSDAVVRSSRTWSFLCLRQVRRTVDWSKTLCFGFKVGLIWNNRLGCEDSYLIPDKSDFRPIFRTVLKVQVLFWLISMFFLLGLSEQSMVPDDSESKTGVLFGARQFDQVSHLVNQTINFKVQLKVKLSNFLHIERFVFT